MKLADFLTKIMGPSVFDMTLFPDLLGCILIELGDK